MLLQVDVLVVKMSALLVGVFANILVDIKSFSVFSDGASSF